jgi:hypothetical protein
MSDNQAGELWSRLHSAALVNGAMPQADARPAVPWFVRVMQGVAGWIGALFLLLSVGIGLKFLVESAPASFIAGLAACALAGFLLRAKPDSDFATQFALAVSLAGQGLMFVALTDALSGHDRTIALCLGLLLAVLFALMDHPIHRVWCAGAGAYVLVIAMAGSSFMPYAPGLLALGFAWVVLHEFSFPGRSALLRQGGYGLALALMLTASLATVLSDSWLWRIGSGVGGLERPFHHVHVWLGLALNGAALLWTVSRLLARQGIASASGAGLRALACAGLLALAGLKAPGLVPSLLILLLGFANGNRVLAGLGVLALLSYLSGFYYSLASTLLEKSALLAATGAALLGMRLALRVWWPGPAVTARSPGGDHA